MNTPVYRIRQLLKAYNGRRVLQIEHLDIQRGEAFAIVGPSGAGKSTLLRLLNFLELPTAGKIYFEATEFSATQEVPVEIRRRVTTVFQRPMLLNRSVWANVHYGLGLRGQHNATERTLAALEKVGLDSLKHQPARTLSGGEAQRVALARAMVLEPDVLLLDEPTANLDPYNISLIEKTVQGLNHEHNTSLVFVTHNIFQARRLAQRVALLLDGQIIEVASVEDFFENPRDPRTAAFVNGETVY
ncbi:MAG: ATP-binding cassette domain-containing protein [Anaerolineales bacterium]|nr:MAG: ATP-binding cassette domain-containing protein [Anaerolineales bacterium]